MNYEKEKFHYHATPADYWLGNINTVKKLLQASDYLDEVQGMHCLIVDELCDAIIRTQNIYKDGTIVFFVDGKQYICTEDTPVYEDEYTKGLFSFVAKKLEGEKPKNPLIFCARLVAGVNIEHVLFNEYRKMVQDNRLEQEVNNHSEN